jgi:hypothetical protein
MNRGDLVLFALNATKEFGVAVGRHLRIDCRYRSNEQVTKKTSAVGAHDNDIRGMLVYAGKDFLLTACAKAARTCDRTVESNCGSRREVDGH